MGAEELRRFHERSGCFRVAPALAFDEADVVDRRATLHPLSGARESLGGSVEGGAGVVEPSEAAPSGTECVERRRALEWSAGSLEQLDRGSQRWLGLLVPSFVGESDPEPEPSRRILDGIALRFHDRILPTVDVLVAGVGNVLRHDDGFGVVVAQRLLAQGLPRGVRVLDVGIGGIHLVQELFERMQALIVVDAIELGRPAGTVCVIEPEVRSPTGPDDLTDMHYATPERALMLAQALGVLPQTTWLVGCQPSDADSLGEGLTPAVEAAVQPAIGEIRRLLDDLGIRP